MDVHHADDVTNAPTGAVKGATEPTVTNADWVPDVPGGSDTVQPVMPKKSAKK